MLKQNKKYKVKLWLRFNSMKAVQNEEQSESNKYPFINYEAEALFLVTLYKNWHLILMRDIDSEDELSYDIFSTLEFYPFVSQSSKDRFVFDLTNSLPSSPVLDIIKEFDVFQALNAGLSTEIIVNYIIQEYGILAYEREVREESRFYPECTSEEYANKDTKMD